MEFILSNENPEFLDVTPQAEPRRAKYSATQKIARTYRTNKVFSGAVSSVIALAFVVSPVYMASSHILGQTYETGVTGYSLDTIPVLQGEAVELEISKTPKRNQTFADLSAAFTLSDFEKPVSSSPPTTEAIIPNSGILSTTDESNTSEIDENWTLDTMPRTWPVDGRRTSSGYGYRTDPITKTRRFHTGTDLSLGCGTPVKAAASGVVKRAENTGGAYGIQIIIDHGSNIFTSYSHLSSISVNRGDSVEIGQYIGGVGTTGRSTGCHLHFELASNGKFLNPVGWLNGTGDYSPVVTAWSEYRTGSSPNGYTGGISRDAKWEPVKDFTGETGTVKENDDDVEVTPSPTPTQTSVALAPEGSPEPSQSPSAESSTSPSEKPSKSPSTPNPSPSETSTPSQEPSAPPTSEVPETPSPEPTKEETKPSDPPSTPPAPEPDPVVTTGPPVEKEPVEPAPVETTSVPAPVETSSAPAAAPVETSESAPSPTMSKSVKVAPSPSATTTSQLTSSPVETIPEV